MVLNHPSPHVLFQQIKRIKRGPKVSPPINGEFGEELNDKQKPQKFQDRFISLLNKDETEKIDWDESVSYTHLTLPTKA